MNMASDKLTTSYMVIWSGEKQEMGLNHGGEVADPRQSYNQYSPVVILLAIASFYFLMLVQIVEGA